MNTKKINWHRVAEYEHEIFFTENNIAIVSANGKRICLGKYNNKLFAFAYTCPHAGGILADGQIDSLGNVVCPLHRYKYSIVNGRNVSGEGYYLKHWPVEMREAGIYVGLEETGFFNW